MVTEVAADAAAAPGRHPRSLAPRPRSPRRPPTPLPLATASPATAALDAATAHGRCGTNPPPQASFCEVISSTLCMKSIDLCYLFFVPLFIALISLGLIQSIRDLILCTSMQ
jgi:site-specific recombinase